MLTRAAIKEMIIPSLLPVLAPDRHLFRGAGHRGQRARRSPPSARCCSGVIVTGPLRRHLDDVGGGAWDNAKKSFEDGFTTAAATPTKGSEAHKASVTATPSATPTRTRRAPP
jgi:K(+)-stimulated pyrophosphate-energized sodium pump